MATNNSLIIEAYKIIDSEVKKRADNLAGILFKNSPKDTYALARSINVKDTSTKLDISYKITIGDSNAPYAMQANYGSPPKVFKDFVTFEYNRAGGKLIKTKQIDGYGEMYNKMPYDGSKIKRPEHMFVEKSISEWEGTKK